MFDKISRSWEFAKMSYRILWRHKELIVFPAVSMIAAMIVTASFFFPLAMTGTLWKWLAFMDTETEGGGGVLVYVTAFLFYFCNYFVIVFFNVGLIANVFRAINGEATSISYGFAFAFRRLPQIVLWALVSAFLGVAIKALEKCHKKAGKIIAAVLGATWTALTYFVVPIIVVEGVGPVQAFKKSVATLRETWGTAVVGGFSLGMLGFLVLLPFLVLFAVLAFLAIGGKSIVGTAMALTGIFVLVMLHAAITSAADMVFKALLYCHATGRSLPADVDSSELAFAFVAKE